MHSHTSLCIKLYTSTFNYMQIVVSLKINKTENNTARNTKLFSYDIK